MDESADGEEDDGEDAEGEGGGVAICSNSISLLEQRLESSRERGDAPVNNDTCIMWSMRVWEIRVYKPSASGCMARRGACSHRHDGHSNVTR